MAQENESSNKAMGWLIAILALCVLGLGIFFMIKYKGITQAQHGPSMAGFQERQAQRVRMLKDIEETLAPSLLSAFENSKNYASPDRIARTRDYVVDRFSELGDDLQTRITTQDPETSSASPRSQFVAESINIEAEEVNRAEVVEILNAVITETGLYATISDIKLEAKSLKEEDIANGLNASSFKWDLDFKLVWFVPNPRYQAPTDGRQAN